MCVKVCVVFLLPEQLYWTGGNAHTGLGCTFYFIFSCSPILSWPKKSFEEHFKQLNSSCSCCGVQPSVLQQARKAVPRLFK